MRTKRENQINFFLSPTISVFSCLHENSICATRIKMQIKKTQKKQDKKTKTLAKDLIVVWSLFCNKQINEFPWATKLRYRSVINFWLFACSYMLYISLKLTCKFGCRTREWASTGIFVVVFTVHTMKIWTQR